MEYYCPHRGHKTELSSSIQGAIKAGKMKVGGCFACDFYVPIDPGDLEQLEIGSLDITCVGPESPACPDPTGVKLINP